MKTKDDRVAEELYKELIASKGMNCSFTPEEAKTIKYYLGMSYNRGVYHVVDQLDAFLSKLE